MRRLLKTARYFVIVHSTCGGHNKIIRMGAAKGQIFFDDGGAARAYDQLMITSLIIYSNLSFAQEKSAFERSLEQDTSVTTTESWVEIEGKRFRKIEFNGGRYYVVFHEGANVADIYCAPPEDAQNEHLTQASEPYRRNAAFVQAFHESCSKIKGNQKTDLHLTPEMGLGFTEGKGTKVVRKKGKPPGE